jgi:hypothetical protein
MADTVSVGMTLTQGVHTVRAWFRDAWGNVSATPATATIALDSVAPTGGTLTATGRDGAVDLSWSGFTDATSGVTSFVVAGAASATAPASCAVGTRLYAGTDARLAHSGLANGTTWSYRVCAVDAAGNTGAGVTATARPAPDYTAPTGTIVLAGGAAWTRSADVAVAMTATGSTDITDVCLSEMTTCTRWSPYAASTTLRLRPTAGTHTVRAWFRDAWGNVSSTPASDTIGLDRTAPAGRPVVTATPGAGRVTLAWSGFTDGTTGSGVTRYRVVASAGTRAPTSCTAGSVAYEGTAARATHRDAVVGTTYQYRVCAIDLVGNMGRGATASATVRTANQAPTAPDIALSSTTPAEGDALTCTVTTPATDADRDALSYVFSWDVDGEAFDGATVAADGLSSTVPAGVTAEGEAWTCAVAADDGATYGEAVEATGTVTSSAPTWTAIWTHALDALPADAMAMNGAWMGQGVTEVAGRTAWIQQSDWNVLYIPVLRSTTAFEAVEADVYVPSNAGFALYPLGAHHGYNGARDFLGFGGSGTSGTMGAAYGGWYDGYSSSAGIVDFATSLPGFSADAWHTVRVETDRTANESAFFLDGEEVLRTTTVPLGALADDVVQLRAGTAAWASANVGWSNLVVYEGTP